MRFDKYMVLIEKTVDEQTPGGEGVVEYPGATTTRNVAKMWNPFTSGTSNPKKKRKKRLLDPSPLNRRLNMNNNIVQDLYDYTSHMMLNEAIVSDKIFQSIKNVGEKMGFKVRRSDNFFDYLGYAETSIANVFNLLCLYIVAPQVEKSELKNEIKQALAVTNKHRLVSFFVKADMLSFGLLSMVRMVLTNVFGIDIGTFNQWKKDIDFIEGNLKSVKEVLMKIHPTQEELDAFDNLYSVIMATKKEIENAKA